MRRRAFGLRMALLAVLAQVIVAVLHQLPHEHRQPMDAAAAHQAAESEGHRGHHDHGPAVPPKHPDPQLCVVGQMLQHMAAVLPAAGGNVLPPDWDRRSADPPRDTEAVIARPSSSAQPRAPPPTA